tara:strand:- start:4065 stop:4400 length:336 start_codon:yes stop_codon:yes gene_type:complete
MPQYLNSQGKCIVCFGPPKVEPMNGAEKNDPFSKPRNPNEKVVIEKWQMVTIPLVRHHVKYFDESGNVYEIICYVHRECHKAIHDGQHPHLIQYNEGDSRKFYAMMKERGA